MSIIRAAWSILPEPIENKLFLTKVVCLAFDLLLWDNTCSFIVVVMLNKEMSYLFLNMIRVNVKNNEERQKWQRYL